MEQGPVIRWFVKCGLSAVLLLFASGFATAWFGNMLQLPATQTRDTTLITLNRYANQQIPDVVLLGSSLTFRLKEEYFETLRLRNLALAGGSPVTGFEIVANQPRLPSPRQRLNNPQARSILTPGDSRILRPNPLCRCSKSSPG